MPQINKRRRAKTREIVKERYKCMVGEDTARRNYKCRRGFAQKFKVG